MGLIGAINWKNLVENLIISIVVFSLGGVVGYWAATKAFDAAITNLKPTIDKAIDKETITNTINNAIDLKIDKIKKSDTLQINVNQAPVNNLKPKSQIIKTQKPPDSIKKGFFGRLFSKDKYKNTSK